MGEPSQLHVTTDAAGQAPDEVEAARISLASLHPSDDEYFSNLVIFANKLMSRFARSGNSDDLDEAFTRTKQILDLAPLGHEFHLPALSNMGNVLTKRFKLRGDPGDLTQGINYLEAAVKACTPERPMYLQLVANLSSSLLSRFRTYGDVVDLVQIIERSSFSLSTCSAASPNRDILFNNWAAALKERFLKQGDRNDLDTALMHYQSCLDLRPPGHPLRHTVLGNLADAMLVRFEVDGHLQDLESATNYYTSALQLLSPGQAGYLSSLTDLGIVFVRSFHVHGDTEKLQMAFSCYQTALSLSTVANLDHSCILDNYGAALRSYYPLSGNVDILDQAIRYLTASCDITPPTYSGRHNTLFTLGVVLLDRYNAMSNIADLDCSIEKIDSALHLCKPGYHQRPIMLSLYGRALCARFKTKGSIQDIHLATSACKEALALASPKELNHSSTVANLSVALYECYFYSPSDTDNVQIIIDFCDRGLVNMPRTDPAFATLKLVRAQTFLEKARRGQEETDLRTSIDAFRETIAVLPQNHVERVPAHWQFGLALLTRFQSSADTKDLDEAIEACRLAHSHCERSSTNYVQVCMQLGNALRECYEFAHGDVLDEAIVLLTEAEGILATTPEHIDYKASLVNLASALFVRFQTRRSGQDLDTSTDYLSRALTLPISAQEFLVLFTLATLLSARYAEFENVEDLERCVKLFSVAAEQMPPRHLSRATLCRNYGHALFKLGKHRDRLDHTDAAIVLYKEALEYLPPANYDHPLTYIRLAEALNMRAQLRLDSDGLYEAINLLRSLLRTLPTESPTFRSVCHTAAKLSMSMYALSESQESSFMEDGFRFYEQAGKSYARHRSFMSVSLTLEWVEHAEKQDHTSALLAYQKCLDSLNQHLLSSASIKGRRAALLDKHWVKQTWTLATDATACAIAHGELELAIELSEQGRGLLWSQMAQSRTPVDALRSSGDTGRALASDFERVSAQLAQSAVMLSDASMLPSRLTTEEAARRYRQLSNELEDIIARIRCQDGFESFSDRPSFQSLQRAAAGGPVVLVNVSRRRCDALIVLDSAPPRLVPLTKTTLEDLTTLSTDLYQMLKRTSHVGEEKTRERRLAVCLRTLWDTVVRPIADDLAEFLPRGARIWWCPTSVLTTLPLHAAGAYRQGAQNLANMYVSSYTPTLAALIRARHPPASPPPHPRTPPGFVAIGQATPSDGRGPELQTVDSELELVRSLAPRTMQARFTALAGGASTADAALAALRTHAWAHLACHGQPDAEQPLNSSFALRDRPMTLLDVVGVGVGIGGRPQHAREFAFLSACHTTVGDHAAPDEVVNLAAAMQFAGFRSVVGTLWEVDDAMAREMVRAFYTHLFAPGRGRGGGSAVGNGDGDGEEQEWEWDCTRAAVALNKAARSVDKAVVAIDQRVVFVHMGA